MLGTIAVPVEQPPNAVIGQYQPTPKNVTAPKKRYPSEHLKEGKRRNTGEMEQRNTHWKRTKNLKDETERAFGSGVAAANQARIRMRWWAWHVSATQLGGLSEQF